MSVDEFAADRAALWKKGLADWDQPQDRIQRYRDAVELSIYTPGSDAGLHTILKSLKPRPPRRSRVRMRCGNGFRPPSVGC